MSATGFHPEPSAKAPWTRTIVLTAAYAEDDAARAAPVRRARIKRLFIAKQRRLDRRPPPGVLKLDAKFSKAPRNITRVARLKRPPTLSVPTRDQILLRVATFDFLCMSLFFVHRREV